jgi:ATP-binding protein involved in chromosome partitioning
MSPNEKKGLIDIVQNYKKNNPQIKTDKLQKENTTKIHINAKRVIGIASGKGGVGKSSITVLIAKMLNEKKYNVGILDADIYGYSIPKLFNLENKLPEITDDNKLIPVQKDGIKLVSMGFLVRENEAAILRGPILHRILVQFLNDVLWGDLDILLIDLPPGTGDVAISLFQLIKNLEVLIVTTPSLNASDVAFRTGELVKKAGGNIIGVIENMSYLMLNNKEKYEVFGTENKGGTILKNELTKKIGKKIPLISSIPIFPDLNVNEIDTNNVDLQKIISWVKIQKKF